MNLLRFFLTQGSQRFSQGTQRIKFKIVNFANFAATLRPLRLKNGVKYKE